MDRWGLRLSCLPAAPSSLEPTAGLVPLWSGSPSPAQAKFLSAPSLSVAAAMSNVGWLMRLWKILVPCTEKQISGLGSKTRGPSRVCRCVRALTGVSLSGVLFLLPLLRIFQGEKTSCLSSWYLNLSHSGQPRPSPQMPLRIPLWGYK